MEIRGIHILSQRLYTQYVHVEYYLYRLHDTCMYMYDNKLLVNNNDWTYNGQPQCCGKHSVVRTVLNSAQTRGHSRHNLPL